ncbi:MAG TPA: TIGR02266 family protein [Anaeromyxobacteraceae bacterium]|nr:TIGR02266 family protein [Anaeromyxobacteraceae bacterium]
MDQGQEKRRDPRVPLVLRVDYPGSERRARDTTENLSASGLFLRTERELAPGDRLPLEISFPGLLAPVSVEVEVVRRRPPGEAGPAGVAVRIPEDRADDRATLMRLAETVQTAASPPGKRLFRVLVVEDNPHVVEMYEYALRKLRTADGAIDVTVEFAPNGHEALVRLGRPPKLDLVMADLYMPVMDGFALVEKLRGDPELADLPVMVISAAGAEARLRALDLGVDVYLQKPVQFADLIGTLRALLRLEAAAPARV